MSKNKGTIDEMLGSIEQVDAPMFLFTKIQANISQQMEASVPVKYVWLAACSFMILLVLNIWTIQETGSFETKDNIAVMVEEMDLMPNNSFY